MKKYMAGAVAGALALTATSLMAAAETVEKWTLTGFEHPESVDLDVPHQVLYVSNIGKSPEGVAGPQPLAKDGNGFISKLSRDGKPIALKWVEGLDAPKGMVMKDYTLWVTDIDRLVEIDTRSGKITNTYPAEGSVFLNDPAVDAKGNVYVSDIAKRKIWKLENGKMSMWYDDDSLMHINGLRVIYGGKLLVAGWGRGMHDDGSTDSPGNLFTIDLKSKEVTNLGGGQPVGNLDGLERDAHGEFLTTDFISGRLLRIHKDGTHEVLLQLQPGTADLDTIDKGRTAIIPRMLQNTVTAYTVD